MIIHHFAKGSPSEKMAGDRSGGSRAHGQKPNVHIEIVPHAEEGAFVLDAKGRDYPSPPKSASSGFHRYWKSTRTLTRRTSKRRKPGRTGSEPKYSIKDILPTLEAGPLRPKEWLEAIKESGIEMSRATFDRYKSEALEQGKIAFSNSRRGFYQLSGEEVEEAERKKRKKMPVKTDTKTFLTLAVRKLRKLIASLTHNPFRGE